MPNDIIKELTDKVIPYSGLWALWGVVLQLYDMRKGVPFKFWILVANIWLAMYVWYLSWVWIPDSVWDVKFSLISLSWFFSYKILHLIEERWLDYLFNKFVVWKWPPSKKDIQ